MLTISGGSEEKNLFRAVFLGPTISESFSGGLHGINIKINFFFDSGSGP